jgi:hypothetical protein
MYYVMCSSIYGPAGKLLIIELDAERFYLFRGVLEGGKAAGFNPRCVERIGWNNQRQCCDRQAKCASRTRIPLAPHAYE